VRIAIAGKSGKNEIISEGHYAKKQIFCQNQIIAWSHSSRFTTTINFVKKYAKSHSKLLDYGCGDGTLLTFVKIIYLFFLSPLCVLL